VSGHGAAARRAAQRRVSISTLVYTTPRERLIGYQPALAATVEQVAALAMR
jgi:hypothetical protein